MFNQHVCEYRWREYILLHNQNEAACVIEAIPHIDHLFRLYQSEVAASVGAQRLY